jgi:hypothetical protein
MERKKIGQILVHKNFNILKESVRKFFQIYEYHDWLIDYLWFYVPLKIFSHIWRCHHYQWRTAKFRSMLGAQGHSAGRDLYRATPAVTRDLGFSGLIRRTAPFSRLLRHTRGMLRTYSNPYPQGDPINRRILKFLNALHTIKTRSSCKNFLLRKRLVHPTMENYARLLF